MCQLYTGLVKFLPALKVELLASRAVARPVSDHDRTMPVRSDPAVKSGAFQRLFGEVQDEMRLTALVAPKTRRPSGRVLRMETARR